MDRETLDTVVRCVECGEHFTITANDAEWFHSRGMFVPKRCRPCRNLRKGKAAPAGIAPKQEPLSQAGFTYVSSTPAWPSTGSPGVLSG